ncbi:LrgB family protein [Brevibacillus agri]|uniref:LrgB family protein n=1 Tax=Brevibacillus TaxID=55080 RepID=UPI00027154E2|nr:MULTISPECIES: LrgB family protein [Brevibacillus]ELK41219.1 holin-like protein CidB [Brevibacillus agri BAB-2500]EJL47450.1 putative effector of murein hydrolase [Brevibacillus sp. CF112]MCG5254589.1 LrgB family protein [Brevibacillus agri]MDN4095216.1 LrgB family protein [Brevibacillus agri]MED1644136.1 LrgB family protein [Brevibacillus agri]
MILWKTCSVVLTILFFYMAKRINKKRPSLLFSPAVLAPAAMIVFLLLAGIPYAAYSEATSWISELMGVVTVAFAVPLYRNWSILMAHKRMILQSLAAGSLIAIIAGVSTAMLVGLGKAAAISVIPRSITLPIALSVSDAIGGMPAMTAVFGMLTSFAGVFLAPWIIKKMKLRHPVSIGLMYGMGAHMLGMVKAFERGDTEGSSATLAVIAGAMITVVWAFTLLPLILSWLAVS